MRSFAISLMLAISLSSTPGRADDCKAQGTTIYFVNGMFTSYLEARTNLKALERLGVSGDIESDPSRLRYDLAYNLDDSFWVEMIQVLRQKLGTDFTTFWRILLNLAPMPQEMQREYSMMLFKLSGSIHGDDDQDLHKHVELYAKDLADSRRVLVVSHSQGNFYALEAFTYLLQMAANKGERTDQSLLPLGVGNVEVATPARMDAWGFPWTTLQDDLVIRIVAEAMGASPANLPTIGAGPPPERDPLGHSFIKAYLNTKESREKIKRDMIATIKEMRYPNWGVPGLTVDLETIKDTGLALEVTKPNGSRAEILADSQVPTGDEFHFESRCSRLQDGTYSFALSTFLADTDKAPYSATLTLRAGSTTHKFKVELKKGQSGGGDKDFLSVQAKREPDGKYVFQVKSSLKEI